MNAELFVDDDGDELSDSGTTTQVIGRVAGDPDSGEVRVGEDSGLGEAEAPGPEPAGPDADDDPANPGDVEEPDAGEDGPGDEDEEDTEDEDGGSAGDGGR